MTDRQRSTGSAVAALPPVPPSELRPARGARPVSRPTLPGSTPPQPSYAESYADAVVGLIPALRVFSRSLCRNVTEADDLVQETLLRGIEKHTLFQPGTNLRAWLFTIMRNRFYSSRIKLGREPTGGADCVSAEPQGHNDGQYWHLRMCELDRALQALPVHYRETIMLIGVLGESYQTAAGILGCDIGTVKSRMNRARTALRDKIGEVKEG